ncbi:hypothetical protein [Cupriavidus sp. DL-D2]|uniref:hypothetical protein n=1 Tax=Cupriavidus sp. DL-D2 TaxID=3144974 RepID=UPI003215EB61
MITDDLNVLSLSALTKLLWSDMSPLCPSQKPSVFVVGEPVFRKVEPPKDPAPSALFGMSVVRVPFDLKRPRMQLTPKVAANLPAAFAAEINAWMAEFFGHESVAYVFDPEVARVSRYLEEELARQTAKLLFTTDPL